jgi:hypothetical protein
MLKQLDEVIIYMKVDYSDTIFMVINSSLISVISSVVQQLP